jgi:hypothetical protein
LKIENSVVAKNREVLSLFNFRNSSRLFTQKSAIAASVVAFVSLVGIMSVRGGLSATPTRGKIKHVLLISLDGLHALDLANFVKSNPQSNLAQLSSRGVVYTQASTSKPSDSFPGLMSIVTCRPPGLIAKQAARKLFGTAASIEIKNSSMAAASILRSFPSTQRGVALLCIRTIIFA